MAFGYLFFLVGLVAVFSIGLAFILDVQLPNIRWQRRALYAAIGGAFVPMLLPLVVVGMETAGTDEFWLITAILLIGSVVMAGVVGFPSAYWFSKRRHLARNPDRPEDVFE